MSKPSGKTMAHIRNGFAFGCLLMCFFGAANASTVQTLCRGNIETLPDRKIVHAGVEYWLWYQLSAGKATVRIAGREFDAAVSTGAGWPGLRLQHVEDDRSLSFLPSDGGTIKVELEPGVVFAGNCLPEKT